MSMRTLANLLEMAAGLQTELGLGAFSPVERDIIAVIGKHMENGDSHVRTETLAAHPLLEPVPRATLHRALRSLLDRGVLTYPDGCKSGRYILNIPEAG